MSLIFNKNTLNYGNTNVEQTKFVLFAICGASVTSHRGTAITNAICASLVSKCK